MVLAATSMLAGDRPNFLLIVSEDNGPELGCYGDPYAKTPHLDKLAADGAFFTRAYVSQPGCSQSRASIYTGLYPHRNGQIGLATWGFGLYNTDIPNLVQRLKAADYQTGIIGKLHINPEEIFPFDFKQKPSGNFAREGLEEYAQFADEFINASDKPFFLAVNYPEAHAPWVRQAGGLPKVPQDADDVKPMAYMGIDAPDVRKDVADYYNCLSRLDSLVGDLLDTLDKSGKSRNTLVIYLGDHGADMLRGKRTVYEGGVLVPLIMRWPDGLKPHQERDELVSTVDLMPTILELAEAAAPVDLDGKSMVSLLNSPVAGWRDYLFTEYHTHAGNVSNFYPQRTVRNERYKLIENLLPGEINPGYEFTMTHTDADFPAAIAKAPEIVRLAYKRMEKPDRWELYDLEKDPFEFDDLSGDPAHASVLLELQQALLKWREDTKDALLDQGNLMRLKKEVYDGPEKKTAAKGKYWKYKSYMSPY